MLLNRLFLNVLQMLYVELVTPSKLYFFSESQLPSVQIQIEHPSRSLHAKTQCLEIHIQEIFHDSKLAVKWMLKSWNWNNRVSIEIDW